MSVRYLIERNYDFSPILLSNGSKIAINFNETGNSCKVIYDPSTPKNGTRCLFEISEAKFPKFSKIFKENQIQTSLTKTHEENQVLKRRHYFDNTTAKTVGPLLKYSDKRYVANSCWELKSKAHSVQELSDKFETYKDMSCQSLYKSSSRLIDRKLTLLIAGRNGARNYRQNGYRRKCQYTEYPYRSQTIGVNSFTNNQSKFSNNKSSNFRRFETMSERRSNGSSSRFSSTICIPYINQRLCYSSINLSGHDSQTFKKLSIQNRGPCNDYFGSTKSMESLFVGSLQTEINDVQNDNGDSKKHNQLPTSPVEEVRKVDSFHENIVKIKSLLRPVDVNESIRFKKIQRMKRNSNNQFDKKIIFFESIGISSSDKEDYKYCSLPGRQLASNLGENDNLLSDA